jgi:DNA invertase Pin-like site-specific DNA recombinase
MRTRKTAAKAEDRKTVGYVRVSTDQSAEGVSLAAQEARIAAYCAAMGWAVSETIRDAGESAKSLKRPGIATTLDAIRRGVVGRIVVAKLDRLTRSVRDLADLIDLCAKHDVALVSVGETLDTSTAAGRMVVNMLGVVAAWEREAIGERTATALAHKRRHRTAYGPTPFGFVRVGDALVPEPQEQLCAGQSPEDGPLGRVVPRDRCAINRARCEAPPWKGVVRIVRQRGATIEDGDGGRCIAAFARCSYVRAYTLGPGFPVVLMSEMSLRLTRTSGNVGRLGAIWPAGFLGLSLSVRLGFE